MEAIGNSCARNVCKLAITRLLDYWTVGCEPMRKQILSTEMARIE